MFLLSTLSSFLLMWQSIFFGLLLEASLMNQTWKPVRRYITTPLTDIKAQLQWKHFSRVNTCVKIWFYFFDYFSKLKDSLVMQSCGIKRDSVFYCLTSDLWKRFREDCTQYNVAAPSTGATRNSTGSEWVHFIQKMTLLQDSGILRKKVGNSQNLHQQLKCWQELTVCCSGLVLWVCLLGFFLIQWHFKTVFSVSNTRRQGEESFIFVIEAGVI